MCIRVRPILPGYEDGEVWAVEAKENKICSLNNNLVNNLDPLSFAMN